METAKAYRFFSYSLNEAQGRISLTINPTHHKRSVLLLSAAAATAFMIFTSPLFLTATIPCLALFLLKTRTFIFTQATWFEFKSSPPSRDDIEGTEVLVFNYNERELVHLAGDYRSLQRLRKTLAEKWEQTTPDRTAVK